MPWEAVLWEWRCGQSRGEGEGDRDSEANGEGVSRAVLEGGGGSGKGGLGWLGPPPLLLRCTAVLIHHFGGGRV